MFKNKSSTPNLSHHSIQGRRSRVLAQALPALNKERNRSSQKNAFTIIEVVLVLAIAGLIFLMVFIALPALQRNQRDTQRKNDMAKLKDAIERYKSNNSGKLPEVGGNRSLKRNPQSGNYEYLYGPFWNYIAAPDPRDTTSFRDPGGRNYGMYNDNAHTRDNGWEPSPSVELRSEEVGFKYVYLSIVGNPNGTWYNSSRGFKCRDDGSLERVSGRSRYTIQIRLESGGVYCIDG
ncbi:MAG: type II secretion system protein [Candidatus Sacchiramonaceae bacterium]|nr:type II secretion system protein [Candidatus Saccharimonadaceae bacterium]